MAIGGLHHRSSTAGRCEIGCTTARRKVMVVFLVALESLLIAPD
jgi:hypothetical protein